MAPKQYQFRLHEDSAAYLDKMAAKHHWSPSITVGVILDVHERLQRIASAFQVSITDSGEELILFRLPNGEFETLEGVEAEGLSLWILQELQKGLVGSFAPDEEEKFFDECSQDYPTSSVGTAMMAIDGYQNYAKKSGKKGKK